MIATGAAAVPTLTLEVQRRDTAQTDGETGAEILHADGLGIGRDERKQAQAIGLGRADLEAVDRVFFRFAGAGGLGVTHGDERRERAPDAGGAEVGRSGVEVGGLAGGEQDDVDFRALAFDGPDFAEAGKGS